MRRSALLLSALTATGLFLTACGGSDSSSPRADPSQSESAPPAPQFWPMTGLKVPDGKTSSLDHPVLVAKMDNTGSSQPQVGLSKADMVVEELVEGGLTRLAAFYYSDIPANVGPIRSMRASDIDVVSPVHASMVTSGAAPKTIALIHAAHIPFYGEGSKGMYRSTQRLAPYNLFVHMNQVATTAKTKAKTPPDYLQWGTDNELPKGVKAGTINAQFSGGHTTQWKFINGSYHNLNSNAPAGDQFPATNVLVLRVREGDAGYLDPAGNHVPKTLLVGKGNALLFHDGRMVAGTWQKGKKADSQITLTTKKGQKLTVPAGHTWIELVPINGGNVTFFKK
ncbi:MAG TPA: DUF3048 domain-containing protein [Nocardioides sp.]|nr:DUF3048 domain-containing protein [Nocardioides sp.]